MLWLPLAYLLYSISAVRGERLCIPNALEVKIKLNETVKPDEITIFSGGFSKELRESGFGKLSADSIQVFTNTLGYNLVFIDELRLDSDGLKMNGAFTEHWDHILVAQTLMKKFPQTKYFVWMDCKHIFIPYPETTMMCNYINWMAMVPELSLIFGREGNFTMPNTNFYFFKNEPLVASMFQSLIDIGLETGLSSRSGYDQEALRMFLGKSPVAANIVVCPHRNGVYNFNMFRRKFSSDPLNDKAGYGDPFVNFAGLSEEDRRLGVDQILSEAKAWREIDAAP